MSARAIFAIAAATLAAAVHAQSKEAPALAAQAQQGTLPPLAQRLPREPLVVKPLERPGTYGGTWRSALRGTADQSYLRRLVSYDSLVRWDAQAQNFVPNLARSWTVAPDARSYTFQLREGVRWSDGTPFTSADILYWQKAKAAKLTGGSRLDTGSCVPAAEGPGTVRFTCARPFGLLLENIAGPGGDELVSYPQHWMRQFHAESADAGKLAAAVAEAKAGKWETLFERRGDPYLTPGKPTLAPWVVVQPYSGTQVVFERNAFYWKVDSAGNQLPYLDRVSFQVAQDNEVLLLKGLNGEFDFHARHFNTLANKAVVMQNRERGRYDVVEMDTTDANFMGIHLNLGHQNEQRRALFQNKDLRIGLSHAIHRAEIIDLVLLGAGTPWQAAPRGGSPHFHATLARQYTEFSTAKAGEHLDKAGLKKDAQGRRLGPDGQPLAIRVTVRSDRPEMQQALQLVQKHWAAVGVRLDLDVVERSLFRQRYRANLHDAAADDIEGGGADFMTLADGYAPIDNTSYFGTAWFNWMDNRRGDPKAALEPPAAVKRAFEAYQQAGQTADRAARAKLIKEILDIAADQFYVIGIAAPSDYYGIVARHMRNVPRKQLDSYALGFPGPYAPEQFFLQR
jgi:peptide/nickel transport system substrate-binding protein